MSSQIGSVASSVVRITSTYPFPRRSPDRALGVGTAFDFIQSPVNNAANDPRPDSRLWAVGQCQIQKGGNSQGIGKTLLIV
jgi:hypothetical protein